MAAADFYKVLPPPILTGEELGVPPAPVAPTPPVFGPNPGDKRKRSASTIGAIIASMIGGPGMGTGIASGTLQGFRQQDQERERNEQQAQQQYQYQQQDYNRQAQMHQQAQAQRQAQYAQAMQSVRQQAGQFQTKDEYDRFVEFAAGAMRANGYRIDANTIRQQAPYVAPKAEALAQETIERWRKNPNNDNLLKNNPEQAMNAVIPFDRDGDGVPERVKLSDLASLARMPFAQNPEGGLMFADKGTTADLKANADQRFADLMVIAKGEGKDVDSNTPAAAKLRNELRTRAQQEVENIQPPKREGEEPLIQITETDPDTGEQIISLVPRKAGEVGRRPPKDPTQGQFTAAGFAGRMQQAEGAFTGLERKIQNMNAARFELERRALPALQSATMQSYMQAARNFINAVLRRESGAVISDEEFAEARAQYLPMPGDAESTLHQKAANRKFVRENLRREAGRAFVEPATSDRGDNGATNGPISTDPNYGRPLRGKR